MTFLKKLGALIVNAAGIAAGVGPLIQPFLGAGAKVEAVVVNDLTQLAQIVTMAEAFFQSPGSGPAKLAASTPMVLQILRSSQVFVGKQITNEPLAEQGAAKIVSGLADFMNAIHADAAQKA